MLSLSDGYLSHLVSQSVQSIMSPELKVCSPTRGVSELQSDSGVDRLLVCGSVSGIFSNSIESVFSGCCDERKCHVETQAGFSSDQILTPSRRPFPTSILSSERRYFSSVAQGCKCHAPESAGKSAVMKASEMGSMDAIQAAPAGQRLLRFLPH